MPTINKPFLLRLILVFVLLGGALIGLHQLQADRIPTALLRQAQRAEDQQRLDAAIHYYRQYLEFRDDDVEARIRLAELLRQRSSGGRTLAEVLFLYDRVLHLEPERHEVRRQALAAALRIGRYSDAVVHAEVLLHAFPNDPLLWQQLGAAQAGLNRLQEARRCYERAVELAPDELLGYQRLAQLLWRNLNDPAAARQVLERMVQALPANPEAHLTRARFELYLQEQGDTGRGDMTIATRHLQRVCELDPESLEATLLLADIYQRRFRWDVAHHLLQEARSLYPREIRLVRALAWLEVSRGNAPAAIAILEESLRHVPDAQDLLIPLADLLIQQGDRNRTAEILQRIQKRPDASLPGRYLQIRLAMRDQKWSEALQLIEAMQGEVPRSSALGMQLCLLRAVCAEQLGDRDAAEKALQAVLLVEPHHAQALHGLGQLYLDAGRISDAARIWEQAAQSPFASGGVLAHWIRFQVHQYKLKGATAEDWRRLEQAAESSSTRFPPSNSEPVVLLAEVLRAQGRFADAISHLRRELGRRPGDVRLWTTLIETVAVWQGSTAALNVADEAQAACGDIADIRLSRGWTAVQEPGQLRPLRPLAQHTEGWPESDQIRLWFGLLDIFEMAGDAEQALALLEQLAARRPQEPTLWLRLHQRALRIGHKDAAERARQALAARYGSNNDYLLLCQAHEADRSAAAALLPQLIQRFGPLPRQPDAALALAHLYLLLEQRDQATQLLNHAFLYHPTHFATAAEWLRHLLLQKDDPEIQTVIQRLRHDPRWNLLATRCLVRETLESLPLERRSTALPHLRMLVESQAGGLAWLGELAARWHLPEAPALLRDAVGRSDATADDWLRLALVCGPSELQEAAKKLPDDRYAAVLALLQEASASAQPTIKERLRTVTQQQQRHFIQTLLGVHLARQHYEQAIALLEGYQQQARERQDRNWVRRQLALLYARQGTQSSRQRALQLLEQTSDELSASAEELRASAQVFAVLSRFLEGPSRRQLLQRTAANLEAAYQKSRAPKDLYDLAQFYRWLGQRADSRRCLQTLLNSDPDNLQYLIAAMEELLEADETAAAETFAQRLQLRHGDDYRAVTALARYWCKVGQAEKARAWVERYAHGADASAGDYWTRLTQVAALLDELARLPRVRGTPVGQAMAQAAAERYATLVPQRPEAAIGLAGVLAYAGQVPQALEQLQRLEGFLPPTVRAAAGLAVIRNARVNESQATLILRWIDDCYQQDPRDLAARLYRAEFWALRQETQRAIQEYESLLHDYPDHVVILNNLAWLLAGDPERAQEALRLVNRALRQAGLTGDLLDTRARARISLRQLSEAEEDLHEALRLEATPLRFFHLALLHLQHTPPRVSQANEAFAQAVERGLDERNIHPADLGSYRKLQATLTAKQH